ncbi:substrate-binding domain-containing protein [Paenibacillus sp. R14(2021)]|uniref:substrate-binding domain-containing protein n=1 Tax=Paenibacillus sp. R14(2021) TaxID=2859228 RepID=UPI001C611E3B|nr:GntR family transcriptional regulator [Paenibacillus sp. R14(2021)]
MKRPMYVEIAEQVTQIIQEQQIKPHGPVPSEGELAKHFGISRMTAKLALDLLADRGLVYRLKRRGTFLSDGEARKGARRQQGGHSRRSIAFVVSNLDYYTSRIVSALESAAREHQFELIIKLSKDVPDEEASLIQLAADGVTGILLFPRGRHQCSPAALKLRKQGYPIVLIDRLFQDVPMDFVLHDHFQGTYEMVKRMIDAGHREIGFVTNPLLGVSSIEERYKGYMKALIDHDIPVQSQYIHVIERANNLTDYAKGNPEVEEFLTSNVKMTAVMCGDDYLAAVVLYAAIRIHKSVPEQLSLAGFSDTQLATLLPVPLASVAQPVKELVQAAVANLLDRMNGKGMSAPSTIKIQTKIVERMSLAKAAM